MVMFPSLKTKHQVLARSFAEPLQNSHDILVQALEKSGFLVDPWSGDSRPVTVKDGEENEQIIPASEVGEVGNGWKCWVETQLFRLTQVFFWI